MTKDERLRKEAAARNERIRAILSTFDAPKKTRKPAVPTKIRKMTYLPIKTIDRAFRVMEAEDIEHFSGLITMALELYADVANVK